VEPGSEKERDAEDHRAGQDAGRQAERRIPGWLADRRRERTRAGYAGDPRAAIRSGALRRLTAFSSWLLIRPPSSEIRKRWD
jgi:hypothetical protein